MGSIPSLRNYSMSLYRLVGFLKNRRSTERYSGAYTPLTCFFILKRGFND